MVATWRYPWQHPDSLSSEPFRPQDGSCPSAEGLPGDASLMTVSAKADLGGLRKLPRELIDIITEYTGSCPLLQYVTVLRLASVLCSEELDNLVERAIDRVSSWHRGNGPNIGDSDGDTRFCRLTIDCWGLRRIEQISSLTDRPHILRGCLFTVVRKELLSSVTAQFRVSNAPHSCEISYALKYYYMNSAGSVA